MDIVPNYSWNLRMGSTIGSPCSEEIRAHAGSLRTFGKKKSNLSVLDELNLLASYSKLKADWTSYRMVVDQEGGLDLCEECGAPLQDGFCHSCSGGVRGGGSPLGAAPPHKAKNSFLFGKGGGARGPWFLSPLMQQGE